MQLAPGTTLDATDAAARQVEASLRSLPEASDVLTTVGGAGAPKRIVYGAIEGFEHPSPVESRLRQTMVNVPVLPFRPEVGGGGTGIRSRQIQLNLQTVGSGTDLIAASQQIMNAIRDVPGLVDLDRSYQSGKPELHVDVDGARAAGLGLNTNLVGATVRTLVNGDTVSRYQDPGREADIVVRVAAGRPRAAVGYTQLVAEHGDRSKRAVAEHRVVFLCLGSDGARTVEPAAHDHDRSEHPRTRAAVGGGRYQKELNDCPCRPVSP